MCRIFNHIKHTLKGTTTPVFDWTCECTSKEEVSQITEMVYYSYLFDSISNSYVYYNALNVADIR